MPVKQYKVAVVAHVFVRLVDVLGENEREALAQADDMIRELPLEDMFRHDSPCIGIEHTQYQDYIGEYIVEERRPDGEEGEARFYDYKLRELMRAKGILP